MEWLAGQPALGKTSDQFYCPECTWYKMIFDVIRVYIPASSYAFLSLRTYTRYQCISHFLRMFQDFLTKLNGKWRHNQRPACEDRYSFRLINYVTFLSFASLNAKFFSMPYSCTVNPEHTLDRKGGPTFDVTPELAA
mgnify:CR=1 FL=1